MATGKARNRKAREYARVHGISYSAARRILDADHQPTPRPRPEDRHRAAF